MVRNRSFTVPQSVVSMYHLEEYARPMVGRSVQVNSLCRNCAGITDLTAMDMMKYLRNIGNYIKSSKVQKVHSYQVPFK